MVKKNHKTFSCTNWFGKNHFFLTENIESQKIFRSEKKLNLLHFRWLLSTLFTIKPPKKRILRYDFQIILALKKHDK